MPLIHTALEVFGMVFPYTKKIPDSPVAAVTATNTPESWVAD
ncbi:MAG: hypothetical protein ACI9LG_002889 [Moritella dasanensis]|jgi:hypothetical protein